MYFRYSLMLPPMNQSKALIAVLVLLLLLLSGGFYLWKMKTVKEEILSSSEDVPVETTVDPVDVSVDTSDWKTYRNEEYGFEMKYPKGFNINNTPTDSGRIVSFEEFDENAKDLAGQKIPGYFPVISIYRWEDINNFDLKGGSWEGEKKYTNLQDFLSDSEHTAISITGETNIDGGRAYVLSMPGEIGYEAVMFEYDGGYYRISFPWTQKQVDESVKRQFLSSIKFAR